MAPIYLAVPIIRQKHKVWYITKWERLSMKLLASPSRVCIPGSRYFSLQPGSKLVIFRLIHILSYRPQEDHPGISLPKPPFSAHTDEGEGGWSSITVTGELGFRIQ